MPELLIESPTRLLPAAAGVGLLGGVAAWLVLVSAGGSARPWLVVALAVTGCLVAAMTALIARRRWTPPRSARPEPATLSTRTDRERGGLESFERRLTRAMEDPGRFNDVLRPQLCGLAEHRLRNSFGVDSRTDPDRARELVGEKLWQLMTTPVKSVPTRQQLDGWIRALEVL